MFQLLSSDRLKKQMISLIPSAPNLFNIMLADAFIFQLIMCRVTSYIGSKDFGHLYDVVLSQRQYFNYLDYWQDACKIHSNQFAVWERIEGSANSDYGSVGINLICLHLHLCLSKHTSPFFIIKEIREYLSLKIGEDIFCDWKFEQWEKKFYNQRFSSVISKFECLI